MKKHKLFLLFAFLFIAGCSSNEDYEIYYPLKNQTWDRFNFLRFEIPVEKKEGLYNVILFVRHTRNYEFETLDFHMIMKTPAGEERIKEYNMDIRRKDGAYIGQFTGDSCLVSIPLKKELRLTQGNLSVQLENVVPRLRLQGVLGVGIRISPVEK